MKTALGVCALVLVVCFLGPVVADAANPCWATLAPDLKLHIPAVRTPAGLFALDLDYSPAGPTPGEAIWFTLAGSSVSRSPRRRRSPAPAGRAPTQTPRP